MMQKLRKHLILKNEVITCNTGIEIDAMLRARKKYSMHSSIARIKNTVKIPKEYSFENIDKEFIEKVIKNLNSKKSGPQNDIPVKILKLNADFVSPFIIKIFNESIEHDNFPGF